MYGELTRKPNGSLSSPARNLLTNKKILKKILLKFENLKIQCKQQHELNKNIITIISRGMQKIIRDNEELRNNCEEEGWRGGWEGSEEFEITKFEFTDFNCMSNIVLGHTITHYSVLHQGSIPHVNAASIVPTTQC